MKNKKGKILAIVLMVSGVLGVGTMAWKVYENSQRPIPTDKALFEIQQMLDEKGKDYDSLGYDYKMGKYRLNVSAEYSDGVKKIRYLSRGVDMTFKISPENKILEPKVLHSQTPSNYEFTDKGREKIEKKIEWEKEIDAKRRAAEKYIRTNI